MYVTNKIDSFPNNKFRLFQTERVCRRQFDVMAMAESSLDG